MQFIQRPGFRKDSVKVASSIALIERVYMVYDCLQETLPALLNHNDDTKCGNMYISASDHFVHVCTLHCEFPKGKRVLP